MRLSRRERIFVGIGVVVLVLLGVYLLLVQPLAERPTRLRQLTARLQGELVELQGLADQYRAVASRQVNLQEQVRTRGTDFTPYSFLENLAGEAGLTGRIESMTPVAAATEEGRSADLAEFDVRLAGIQLRELVRFLYSLETSDKVFFVVNLSIRPRYLTPDLLDVNLRLATPMNPTS